jgi:dipeptidase D
MVKIPFASYLLLFLIPFAFSEAKDFSPTFWQDLDAASSNEKPLVLFRELSRTVSPSGEEAEMTKVLRDFTRQAKTRYWPRRAAINFQTDTIGNTRITVPGTGRLTTKPSIALQCHSDMVLQSVDYPKEPRLAFVNGVEIDETKGWLHSKNFKTTLGADNRMGMALALKYLVEPQLEHPPLEIFITVQEEVGLKGVRDFQLPLLSRQLINLDWEEEGVLCNGCMGSRRLYVDGELPSIKAPEGLTFYEITLQGLEGGHSGLDIHKRRLNAVYAATKILSWLRERGVKIWLSHLEIGDRNVLNTIPNQASMKVAFSQRVEDGLLKKQIDAILKNFPGDNPKKVVLSTKVLKPDPQRKVVEPGWLGFYLDSLSRTQDGVIVSNPLFPNSVQTASNLGSLQIKPGEKKRHKTSLGVMLRSFVASDLESYAARQFYGFNRDKMEDLYPHTATQGLSSKPWRVSGDSPLFRLANRLHLQVKTAYGSGGLEPAILAEKFPDVEMIAYGPTIIDPHTVKERVNTASVRNTSDFTDRLLQAVGCPEILTRK